jgi:hypothetical protein
MPWFGKKRNKGPQPPQAPTKYKDKHLEKGFKPQTLGAGTENEVFKTRYKDKYSPTGKEGYFKEDSENSPAKYAVGASRLAQGIGLGHLIPETSFAEHTITDRRGKKRTAKGAMSLRAPGESLGNPVVEDQTERALAMNEGVLPSDREVDDMWSGWQKRGDRMFTHVGFEVADFDLSASHTQKQLNQLQWFDALIRNADRHPGNILFDPTTGNISGIDNDLSFGKGFREDDDRFAEGVNDKFLGLPSLIDQETADMLLSLTPQRIAELLNPKGTKKSQKFTKKELQQTYDRLDTIQKVVRQKVQNGEIVKQWDKSTYDQQIQEKPGKGVDSTIYRSYLSRHHHQLNAAKDTSNPASWRRGHQQEDTTPAPIQPVQQTQPAPVQSTAPQPTSGSQAPRRTPPPVPSTVGRPPLSSRPTQPTLTRSDSRTGGISLEERKRRLFAAMGA